MCCVCCAALITDDLVNGTNDRVHGNYDRIFNLASSDTVRCGVLCAPSCCGG